LRHLGFQRLEAVFDRRQIDDCDLPSAAILPYAAGALTSFNSAAAVDMDNMVVVAD
jgi:hypothetical protein